MIKKEFGAAGKKIVIQEKLSGQEVSVLAITDGKTIIPLSPAQDHKRIFDNDKGPNTGGMGAYAPTPFVTKNLSKIINDKILKPTIIGMKKEGHLYKGVLYAGLMLTNEGPKVLEFNVRFGDPETQPLMMLLKTDLLKIIFSCINGTLDKHRINFKQGASVCIVLASSGYPDHYKKGETIYSLNKNYDDIEIFHAGTSIKNDKIVTNGGRVLGITAFGKNISDAIKKAYSVIGKQKIYFNNMQYRKDIGKKAIKD